MSLGFSLSDIIVSYELASDIYYRCFTKAQSAGAPPATFLGAITLVLALSTAFARIEGSPVFLSSLHSKLLTDFQYVGGL